MANYRRGRAFLSCAKCGGGVAGARVSVRAVLGHFVGDGMYVSPRAGRQACCGHRWVKKEGCSECAAHSAQHDRDSIWPAGGM